MKILIWREALICVFVPVGLALAVASVWLGSFIIKVWGFPNTGSLLVAAGVAGLISVVCLTVSIFLLQELLHESFSRGTK